MICVRHGLMIVGEPYSGKSSCIKVLSGALGMMEEKGYGENKVMTELINTNF
jgi:dynein heavy chain, axonemal